VTDEDYRELCVRTMRESGETCSWEAGILVSGAKNRPRQPPLPWLPPLVLSTSAYSVSVLRPPTSRLAAWGNINATTFLNSLSNLARDLFLRLAQLSGKFNLILQSDNAQKVMSCLVPMRGV
jgi:hypothetical protein